MKVVLVGVTEIDGRSGVVWDQVRAVLQSLGPLDVVVHSGGGGAFHTVGSMVDSIKRRARGEPKKRLPKIEVQLPETVKFARSEALAKNALQMIHHHRPDAVVYIGYGDDDEAAPVIEQATVYNAAALRVRPIAVQEASEFIAERTKRT